MIPTLTLMNAASSTINTSPESIDLMQNTSLVLVSPSTHPTIKLSRMKIFKTGFRKYRFCWNSGNDAYAREWFVILFASLWRISYENRNVTCPFVCDKTRQWNLILKDFSMILCRQLIFAFLIWHNHELSLCSWSDCEFGICCLFLMFFVLFLLFCFFWGSFFVFRFGFSLFVFVFVFFCGVLLLFFCFGFLLDTVFCLVCFVLFICFAFFMFSLFSFVVVVVVAVVSFV